jgi:hypothetical protein
MLWLYRVLPIVLLTMFAASVAAQWIRIRKR